MRFSRRDAGKAKKRIRVASNGGALGFHVLPILKQPRLVA